MYDGQKDHPKRHRESVYLCRLRSAHMSLLSLLERAWSATRGRGGERQAWLKSGSNNPNDNINLCGTQITNSALIVSCITFTIRKL